MKRTLLHEDDAKEIFDFFNEKPSWTDFKKRFCPDLTMQKTMVLVKFDGERILFTKREYEILKEKNPIVRKHRFKQLVNLVIEDPYEIYKLSVKRKAFPLCISDAFGQIKNNLIGECTENELLFEVSQIIKDDFIRKCDEYDSEDESDYTDDDSD